MKVRTLGLIFKHCNTVCAHFCYLLPCCFYCSYHKNNIFLCSLEDKNSGVILHHVEGWLYDPIILAVLRDYTSESTDPRPHFQALQYRLCSVLSIATLLFLIVPITKINIYYHYYAFITISSPNLCTHINYHCIWCVGDTRDFLLFGCRVV